jgi:NADH dehydrogenase FAD-containing subunit
MSDSNVITAYSWAFFGVDGIEQNAFKMKSIADASILRNQVIEILEQAHVEQDNINSRR